VRSLSLPATIRNAPGAGWAFGYAAVPLRRWQRLQWQWLAATSGSVTSNRTVPQLQPPVSGKSLISGAKVTVDQCVGELLLSADELEPVRLELVGARVVRVQRLSRRDEHEDCFL
jgi:hypothetical protein